MVYIQIERTWSSKKVGYGGLEISHSSRVREGFLEEVALGLGLRITLPTKVHLVKAMVFPVVM